MPNSSQLVIEPIGIMRSVFAEKFGTPRQSGLSTKSHGTIIIDPKYQPQFSLQGLEGFSHIWVLFYFHKNRQKKFRAKIHPPRLLGTTMGVFATRSPHRPNPIGLSLVKLEKIVDYQIHVSGLDIIDNTPVIDIKPYLAQSEAINNASQGWIDDLKSHQEETLFKWSEAALESLANAVDLNETLKELIEESLALDPRPLVYKTSQPKESYRQTHIVRLDQFDVEFKFLEANLIEVLNIKKV